MASFLRQDLTVSATTELGETEIHLLPDENEISTVNVQVMAFLAFLMFRHANRMRSEVSWHCCSAWNRVCSGIQREAPQTVVTLKNLFLPLLTLLGANLSSFHTHMKTFKRNYRKIPCIRPPFDTKK